MARKRDNQRTLQRVMDAIKDKEREKFGKNLSEKAINRNIRTSSRTLARDGGTLVGKVKDVSSAKPNFIMQQGGDLIPSSGNKVVRAGVDVAEEAAKDLIPYADNAVVTTGKVLKTSAMKASKMALAKAGSAALGLAGLLMDSDPVGEDSDKIPTEEILKRNPNIIDDVEGFLANPALPIDPQMSEEILPQMEAKQKMLGTKQTLESPEIAAKIVKESDLPVAEKDKVLRDIQSPTKMSAAVAEGDAPDGSPSIKSQFLDSLAFFMPQAIGLGVGALIEGSEGAVAGYNEAGKMASSYRQYNLDKEKLAQTKASKLKSDVKTFVNAETGTPVKYDDASNIFTDLNGVQLDPSSVTQATTFRQTRSLDQREAEAGLTQTRHKERLGLKREELAQLSDKQVESLGAIDRVLTDVDTIAELSKKVSTGPVAGRAQGAGALVGMANEDFVALRSELNSTLAGYVKSISGAQVSDREAVRLQSIIPDVNDPPATFQAKLTTFKSIVNRNKNALAKAISSGQPLKSLEGLDEAAKKYSAPEGQATGKLPKFSSYATEIDNAKTLEEIEEINKKYKVK